MRELFPETRFHDSRERLGGDDLIRFLSGAQAALIGTERFDAATLDRLPELRAIGKYGVGLDNLPQGELERRGIALGWQGGVNRRSVAELALAAMLGLAHNVFRTGAQRKRGEWNKSGGQLLSEKTVGVIGCGFAGTELLELLRPFGCRFLINDIIDKSKVAQAHGADTASLASFEQTLSESDFVSLHVPLTEATREMIGANELRALGKGSAGAGGYLINTSRGEVVNEAALAQALKGHIIAGAFLDVYQTEPCLDSPLMNPEFDSFWGTPHIGGNAKEAVAAMGAAAIENLQQAMRAAGLMA